MNSLPVQRASQLSTAGLQTQWLVEGLWSDQAVGILGGEPKCCKSFLALDVAVSVASGAACLRQFPVRRTGKVLLFPAEDSNASRPGQALRGSSELHGWGDFNLYLRRKGSQLTLSTEHRAAPSQDPIPLQLTQYGPALALSVLERPVSQPGTEPTPVERVRQTLAQLQEPVPVHQLRKLCGMRTAAVCSALGQLSQLAEVSRNSRGYQLNLPFPVSRSLDPQGNGNGKHPICSSAG